jgi:two-component system, cell cycle response regulator
LSAVRVALIGFTRFERATFESFFRLAAKRAPAYQHVEQLHEADFVVANADDATAVAEVQRMGKLAHSLMLGALAQPGAAQQLARPINLMLVVRALDTLALNGVPVSAGVQRVLADLGTTTSVLPPGMDPRALVAAQAPAVAAPAPTGWAGAPRLADLKPVPPPVPHAAPPVAAPALRAGMDHILVVDDSDIALRFMANNLQRFGFEVHLVRSGQEAIARVAERHFEFVFLDVMMDGLNGFQTCKAIKRSAYADNRPPPTVVMLTSRGAAVDKLRGTMAGADAYLTKPLVEAELLKVVGDREVAKHAYADTASAANSVI